MEGHADENRNIRSDFAAGSKRLPGFLQAAEGLQEEKIHTLLGEYGGLLTIGRIGFAWRDHPDGAQLNARRPNRARYPRLLSRHLPRDANACSIDGSDLRLFPKGHQPEPIRAESIGGEYLCSGLSVAAMHFFHKRRFGERQRVVGHVDEHALVVKFCRHCAIHKDHAFSQNIDKLFGHCRSNMIAP